jgi:hypothetical protein
MIVWRGYCESRHTISEIWIIYLFIISSILLSLGLLYLILSANRHHSSTPEKPIFLLNYLKTFPVDGNIP